MKIASGETGWGGEGRAGLDSGDGDGEDGRGGVETAWNEDR